jgi:hypothetical protein
VTFDQLKLFGKSVEAYRRSASMGETVAMSNLGNKFLGVGFVSEAKEQCEAALKIGNPHKNVGELFARATELPELEDKRQQEILEGIKQKIEFYGKLGDAVSAGDIIPTKTKCAGPDCSLEMTRSGNKVALVGEFERDPNPLGIGLLSSPSGTSPPSKIKYKVRFAGTVRGGAIFGAVKRSHDRESLLSSAGAAEDVLMIYTSDPSSFSVMENPDADKPRFYQMLVS